MRTEDEFRRALSQAAQQAASPAADARVVVGRRVRRQRAWRLGAVAGVALAVAAFALVTVTRPDHRASVRVVSPTPSPSPTAVPGPAPDTGVAPPAASQSGTVPAGFSAVSVTFVSAKEGFVLGSAPCATPPCTVILRTSDTGKTWRRMGAPPADIGTPSGPGAVGQIRFATSNDGWVFGPDLWATHDAGAHWSAVAHDGTVRDLEASAGTAHMVVLAPRSPDQQYEYRILSTPVSSDNWVASPTTLPKGPAPVAGGQLVLQGRTGWLLISERVVEDGARLTPDGWKPWKPPCGDAFGPGTLLAPTADHLVAVCREGDWGGSRPPGTGLYLSGDGGATFARAPKSVPGGAPAASGSTDTIIVNGQNGLWGTFDRGVSWSHVYDTEVTELGFTTPTQGIGLEASAPDQRATRFVLSTDGGHHWRAMPFGPTATADRRCATTDLKLSLAEPASQGVSQQQTLTFAITNASRSACFVQGYPGVALLTPDGARVPFTYARSGDEVVTSAKPARIALGPGVAAWITLNKTVCQAPSPTAATAVQLIPPDERDALSLALASNAASFAACDPSEPGSIVHVSPVSATPRETLAH